MVMSRRDASPCVAQEQHVMDDISAYFNKEIGSLVWNDEEMFKQVIDKSL